MNSWQGSLFISMRSLSNYALQAQSTGLHIHHHGGQEGMSGGDEEGEQKTPDAKAFHPLDNFARVQFCLPSRNTHILRPVSDFKAGGCLVLGKQWSQCL